MIVPVDYRDTPLCAFTKRPKSFRDFVLETLDDFNSVHLDPGKVVEVKGFPMMGHEPTPSDAARIETVFKDYFEMDPLCRASIRREGERIFLLRGFGR